MMYHYAVEVTVPRVHGQAAMDMNTVMSKLLFHREAMDEQTMLYVLYTHTLAFAESQARMLAHKLRVNNFTILRYKLIERVIDSDHHDQWQLLCVPTVRSPQSSSDGHQA